jgi:radical SAM superfamily enzyme YgiQ (UPF0313 family)
MNILLIAPYTPDSFWKFESILPFVDKKTSAPPLGLITVSAMLPKSWNKRLVDLNVTQLRPKDILWADYVFITAMYIQKESALEAIALCKQFGAKIVGGGPMFTQEYEQYLEDIDHFVLNEAEITLPMFLEDLKTGQPKKVYRTDEFADMTQSPIPDYGMMSIEDYLFMSIQVSRGCPFSCEFCEITALFGHKMRMKTTQQVINELDALFDLGWRGQVMFVDDNFIGNRKRVKCDLLPAIRSWSFEHNYPFVFNTQATIDLADDGELTAMLVDVGFSSVFIGIETPDENTLSECNKKQNTNRNLLRNVRKLQIAGLMVTAGFIVGFDTDTDTIFQRQINFIEKSGITTAMVGLLNAYKNSPLYKRLESENRLLSEASGNNTELSLNYVPVMPMEKLIEGYEMILRTIYDTNVYYRRVRTFLEYYNVYRTRPAKYSVRSLKALIKVLYALGVVDSGRIGFWKLLFWTCCHRPHLFADAVELALYKLHFQKVFGLGGQARTETDERGWTVRDMLQRIMRKKGSEET